MNASRNETASDQNPKFILKQRERVPIKTTQGNFFARHLTFGDLRSIVDLKEKSETDLADFAQRMIKLLVCTKSADDKTSAITDEIYQNLSVDDMNALAEGISKACNLTLPLDENPLNALGSALFDEIKEHKKRMAESAAKIQETLDSSFSSMSTSLKKALGENLIGISSISEALKMSPAVEAIQRLQNGHNQLHGHDFLGASAASEALRKIQKNHDFLSAKLPNDFLSKVNDVNLLNVERIPLSPSFPKVDQTPIGRAANAAEASADQLQEVSGLVGQMVDQLGKLHTLFLTQVIPQWVKNLSDSAKATNTSIGLAKQAIYWSIGVTVLMTCWQLWIAREYKLDNDRQQLTSEALLRNQLQISQDLNAQLSGDFQRLQKEVIKLNQTMANIQQQSPVINMHERREQVTSRGSE